MSWHYDPDTNCLTKAEIARFLRISQRQAARLMMTMQTIAIGRNQRRVLRKDFDDWLAANRQMIVCDHHSAGFVPKQAKIATKYRGPRKQPSCGSVAEAAEKVRVKRYLKRES